MRIIQGFTWCKILFNFGPYGNLTSVRQQHTDNGAFLCCLFYREQCFAGHPSIGHSLVISFTGTLAYDDVEAVVAEVTGLSRTLDTIT